MKKEEIKRARGALDYIRAKGKLWLLVGGIVAGVLLLMIGTNKGVLKSESTEKNTGDYAETAEQLNAYRKDLEGRLEKICESVAGVSQVDVLITLGSGCRVVYTTDNNGNTVTVGSGSAQKPLYRTLEPPTVIGVGIVCRGGNDPNVQKELTDLISTALGITSNRVCITGK